MAKKRVYTASRFDSKKKKTRQGNGKFSKHSHKGGGPGGSTPSKKYRKRYRGQGKRR